MNTLSPEEKYLMIQIGCEYLKEGRETISKLSKQKLAQKIKEETTKKNVIINDYIILNHFEICVAAR
jgi:hypothetical protein